MSLMTLTKQLTMNLLVKPTKPNNHGAELDLEF